MVGGIEGFVVDEVDAAMDQGLDIDWDTGIFDPEEVRAEKRKEINTMIKTGVFEAISPDEEDSEATWLSARWGDQQRDGEVRCRCIAREFRALDPAREGIFFPSSDPTTGMLIDVKAVR